MFEGVSLMELLLVAVVGLVVLGPERLPVAVRSVMSWVRAMKRMLNSVQVELEQELKIEQLHADLKKAESQGLSDLSPELQTSIAQLQQSVQAVTRPYQAQSESEPKVDIQSKQPASSHGSAVDQNVVQPVSPHQAEAHQNSSAECESIAASHSYNQSASARSDAQ